MKAQPKRTAAEKTAQRHLDTILRGAVDRSTVIGLRKLINASHRKERGYSIGSTAAAVDMTAMWNVADAVEMYKPRIVGELHTSGVKLLTNVRHKKKLADVAHIVADLHCFWLVEFEMMDDTHCVPVYRALDSQGRWFDFRNVPWQSGGKGPEVLRYARKI